MATVVFAGTTIWNDATTGVNRVEVSANLRRTRWALRVPPRGQGYIAKDLGTAPGYVVVPMEYRLTSSEWNSLAAVLDGKKGSVGALVVPPGQTYSDAILVDWRATRGGPVLSSGTIRYLWQIVAIFEQLR